MKLLILLLAIGYSACLPVTLLDNPCVDGELYYLRYFQPYPLDDTKYYECNPWNGYVVRECRTGLRWNNWLGRCSDERLERTLNATVFNETFYDPSLLQQPGFNITTCRYYGNDSCLNGGVCNQFPLGGICQCPRNVTGQYCDVVLNGTSGAFGELINSSFSLDLYRQNRQLVDEFYKYNGTVDTSSVQDNQTRALIAQYIALYQNGTMRFDMLVNYLIQDYLSLIYPWQFFLQEFGLPSEMQMGYVNAIPSLLMSSKYAFDRFYDMWAIYEDVLSQLVEYLSRNIPTIHTEAELFFEIYDGIFKQFEQVSNFSALRDPEFFNQSFVTVEMIRSKIRRSFNDSLGLSYELFDTLNRFDEEIGVRSLSVNGSFFEEALANFTTSPNVTELVGQLSDCNAEIWDSLSFYGFWYVVSEFVDHQKFNFTQQNSSVLLNGTTIARRIKPIARPSGVFNQSRQHGEDRFDADANVPVFQALTGDETLFNTTVQSVNSTLRARDLFANSTVLSFTGNETVPVSSRLSANWTVVNSTVVPARLVSNTSRNSSLETKFAFLTSDRPVNVTVARLDGVPVVNTSLPTVARLVGDVPLLNTSVPVVNASLPVVARLSSDAPVVNVSVGHLEGNWEWSNTSSEHLEGNRVVLNGSLPVTSHLQGEPVVNTSVPTVARLVADVTILNASLPVFNTSLPVVARLVADVTVLNTTVVNTSVPTVARLVGDVPLLNTSVPVVNASLPVVASLSIDAPVVNVSVGHLEGNWQWSNTSSEHLEGTRVVFNSSLPVTSHLEGEDNFSEVF